MATILITGGTGLVGKALQKSLLSEGHTLHILSRSPRSREPSIRYFVWDPQKHLLPQEALEGVSAIVNLAGSPVAEGRWSAEKKREIVQSRVQGGETLVKALQSQPHTVTTVVSASAQGWYGPDPVVPNPAPFEESAPPHSDFLGATCQAWEASVKPLVTMGLRLVLLRIGIVLSTHGGAYAEFRKPFRFGMATVLGSGRQVISWIHIQDLVRIIGEALTNREMEGVYNAAAPQPVDNRTLIHTIKKVRNSTAIVVTVPPVALRIGLGEMSIEVLKSCTMSTARLSLLPFHWNFSTIESAVRSLEKGDQ